MQISERADFSCLMFINLTCSNKKDRNFLMVTPILQRKYNCKYQELGVFPFSFNHFQNSQKRKKGFYGGCCLCEYIEIGLKPQCAPRNERRKIAMIEKGVVDGSKKPE